MEKLTETELTEQYEQLNKEIENEKENLIYLLNTQLIEYINLLSIHYIIKDLIFKRNEIKDILYRKYNKLITEEV